MKQNDAIETLFKRLEGSFNIEETPQGHQNRFLEKLEATSNKKTKGGSWWKPLAIAASVALLVTLGWNTFQTETSTSDLASVSPELKETQSFFTAVIHEELETLKSFEGEDIQKLVDDAMESMKVLEADYEKLKIDLAESGNDKRVIAAMIANFQSRIDILEQVNNTIEEIKTLKANTNETII